MIPPDWPSYFIGLAHTISKKSHDEQTQHGCVISDSSNRILSVGYNGFPRGIDDSVLPRTRPDKYPWMIHAERNALANCLVRPEGATAYVTGQCCNDCIISLYQEGVSTVYMHERHGSHLLDDESMKIFKKFVTLTGIKIYYVRPDLIWLKEIYNEKEESK